MQILAEVFWGSAGLTGVELARRTGVAQPTVAREVARLERAGLVITRRLGSAKTIHPNDALPYSAALQQLLAYAGGIVPMLRQAFRDKVDATEVFVFGSWAARYHGQPGAAPNDVDVAVVSSALTRFDLAAERFDLESASGLVVNLFVFEPDHERLAELRTNAVRVLDPVTA